MSKLAAAATAFEAELAQYTRLGELFVKTPLGSVKHLERANQLLGEIAQVEERLQTCGKDLVQAIAAARQQQEQLAESVVAQVPALSARNAKLTELMGELAKIATDVAELNTAVTGAAPDAAGISERVFAMSARALALGKQAQEAQLEEVATQAHALHQRLESIAKKLQKAGATN
jgi:chromosome segregation ATPase